MVKEIMKKNKEKEGSEIEIRYDNTYISTNISQRTSDNSTLCLTDNDLHLLTNELLLGFSKRCEIQGCILSYKLKNNLYNIKSLFVFYAV